MSRMVPDDFWQPPVDKKAVVDREFARAGISRDGERAPEPEPVPKATVDRLAELDRRDGFLRLPGGRLISPTLAHQLHYRETPPAPAAGPAIEDSDAEARSLDEAMR